MDEERVEKGETRSEVGNGFVGFPDGWKPGRAFRQAGLACAFHGVPSVSVVGKVGIEPTGL